MDPNSALPSYRVYRGSLMALLIGSVFAVWLLVRPGGEADQAAPPAALAAVLPTQTPALATPPARTPAPGVSPTPTATPAVNATAAPAATTPTRTPTPAASTPTPANRSYTVKPGDTLYGIADQFRGTVPLADYFERILTLNGLRETSLLAAGDVIRIPPP
jgi:LysM repeat protein